MTECGPCALYDVVVEPLCNQYVTELLVRHVQHFAALNLVLFGKNLFVIYSLFFSASIGGELVG